MTPHLPERIAAAVELLAVQPHDHLLEIGCGNGAAASLVCERLANGKLVAIDRSEKQISLASKRNRAHLEAGKLTLHVMALESAALGGAQFDKIFASNVNCFWLDFKKPLAAVKQLLKPNGAFFIFYQQPGPAKMREVSSALHHNLVSTGFDIRHETATGPVYCLECTLSNNRK